MIAAGRDIRASLVRGAVFVGAVLLPTLPTQAGPIWDCLTGKSKTQPCQGGACQGGACQTPVAMPLGAPVGTPIIAQYPATAQYPVTSAYYPVAYPQAGVAPMVAPVGNTVPNATTAVRGYTPYAQAPVATYRPVVPATPVQTYRPWSTPYAPAPVVGVPVTVGTAPVGAMAAGQPMTAGAAPVCAACQRPMTVNIAPQVSYRSSWVQVPVTSYRPVAGIDPRTGQVVTVYQACTSSTWQLQRVPTLIQRPLVTNTAAGVPVCANGACAMAPAGTPYYGAPVTGAPITGAPITGAPIMGGNPYGVPAGPLGGTPADRPPSLNPNDLQPAGPQIRNYPGIDAPTSSFGVPGAAVPAQSGSSMIPVPPATASGFGVPSSTPYSSAVAPPPNTAPFAPNAGAPSIPVPTAAAPSTGTPPTGAAPGVAPSIPSAAPANKSIPDPETKSASREREIPPLLNNPNRAASVRARSSVSLIPTRLIERIPSPPTADRGAQAPQEAVPQQPVPQQEDPQATDPVLAGPRTTAPLSDDGWRTVPQGSAR